MTAYEDGRGQRTTKDRLVEAAIGLFARKWYGTVSVAEICREAGLSNGVFYRYFSGKEELFKTILSHVLDMIREALDAVGGDSARERLFAYADTILRFSSEHTQLVAVFREGQYRFFAYEHELVAIYERSLGKALGREVGLPEYLFALGGLRFCAIRKAFQASPIDHATLQAILEGGIFRGLGIRPEIVFGGSAHPLPIPLEEGARERLLRAGKRLFGEKGYFETNIHEVTDAAGLSVGALYTYFDSKESFYAELIKLVGHEVRSFIAANLTASDASSLNALEFELRGLWLWLVYLAMDRHCYNIVREAEFVIPAAVREYYSAFAAGYRRRPSPLRLSSAAPSLDEETVIEFLMGIAHYFGIEVAFDGSVANARAALETLGRYLSRGFLDYLA